MYPCAFVWVLLQEEFTELKLWGQMVLQITLHCVDLHSLILIVFEDVCFLHPYQLRYYGILIFTILLGRKVCHCSNVYFRDSGKVKYLKIISHVTSHNAKNLKYRDTTTVEQIQG